MSADRKRLRAPNRLNGLPSRFGYSVLALRALAAVAFLAVALRSTAGSAKGLTRAT
jgi:hypothetical protein